MAGKNKKFSNMNNNNNNNSKAKSQPQQGRKTAGNGCWGMISNIIPKSNIMNTISTVLSKKQQTRSNNNNKDDLRHLTKSPHNKRSKDSKVQSNETELTDQQHLVPIPPTKEQQSSSTTISTEVVDVQLKPVESEQKIQESEKVEAKSSTPEIPEQQNTSNNDNYKKDNDNNNNTENTDNNNNTITPKPASIVTPPVSIPVSTQPQQIQLPGPKQSTKSRRQRTVIPKHRSDNYLSQSQITTPSLASSDMDSGILSQSTPLPAPIHQQIRSAQKQQQSLQRVDSFEEGFVFVETANEKLRSMMNNNSQNNSSSNYNNNSNRQSQQIVNQQSNNEDSPVVKNIDKEVECLFSEAAAPPKRSA